MNTADLPVQVVSWNVENLAGHLGETPRQGSVREIATALGSPDVLCLQEVRLRPIDTDLVRLAETALPGYSLTLSLADDPKNVFFRGGRAYGVGTYARRALGATSLERQSWDREGRMVVTTLEEMKLCIVNVYAVNGTSKPYWNHDVGRTEGDRHGWKRRLHDLVAAVAGRLAARGLDPLLIGDWNVSQQHIDTTPRLRTEEPHTSSRAHFAETLVRGLDMVDVFRAVHPDARAYTWFNRRARPGKLDAARVDFALFPRSRMHRIVEATIDEASAGSFGSDHAPIRVRISRA